ncbi:MAG: hypothetical protein JWR52_57 [Marmoricola sp.]|nr:hypothetical protein [Marmoricola sp.]
MTENQGPEDQLTRTLSDRADAYVEDGGAPVELSSVLARAGEIRRGRRLRASLVMAAVVLAVAVPVGITVLDDQPGDGHPSPAGQPTGVVSPTTTPSPAPTPTPTEPAALPDAVARVPRGPAPDHSYISEGVLHNSDGSTRRLPWFTSLDVVTPYLGGYLVANEQTGIVSLYDGAGTVVKSGPGSPEFVTTSDGVETAYVMNGTLYSNPGSGMASGDGAVGPVDPSTGRPIGYLPGGGLLYVKKTDTVTGAPTYAVAGGASATPNVDWLSGVSHTDDLDNLVAGGANGIGMVISLTTHKTLWSSPVWDPVAFSYDGKYVAAMNTQTTDTVAILDARTGRVVASTNGMGVEAKPGPVFDDTGNLLFIGVQSKDEGQAILRLTPGGKLTRSTAVVLPHGSEEFQFTFPVGPQ